MLMVVLKQVGFLTKTMGAVMPWIKRDTRQRFTRLEMVQFCNHPSRFYQDALGFLADEVIVWGLGSLSFRDESEGKSNSCRLILCTRRSIHDEAHKTVRTQSYLHGLVGSHASGRKQI